MTVDKLVDSTQLDSDLTSVANAIRTKGGTSASLSFPNDFVSAIGNIPTGITPTGTKSISITPNGTTTEDVTNYANAEITTNVPTTLKLGVIRPDAELVQTWNYDKLIVQNEGKTIPAYNTNSNTLLEWTALTPTYSTDLNTYDYYLLIRTLSIPIYNVTTTGQGRQEYAITTAAYEIQNTPANYAKAILDGTTTNNVRVVTLDQVGNYGRSIHWSNASTLTMTSSTNQGAFQQVVVGPAMSAGTVTARAPRLCIRGDSNILNSTYWGALTDIRFQYVLQLWRAPKNNLNYNGWCMHEQMIQAIDCANSSPYTLT